MPFCLDTGHCDRLHPGTRRRLRLPLRQLRFLYFRFRVKPLLPRRGTESSHGEDQERDTAHDRPEPELPGVVQRDGAGRGSETEDQPAPPDRDPTPSPSSASAVSSP